MALRTLNLDTFESGITVHSADFDHITPTASAENVQRGTVIDFPRGRLVFKAQALLMIFLVLLVEAILTQPATEKPRGVSKWNYVVQCQFREFNDLETNTKTGTEAYDMAPAFDITTRFAIPQSRLRETEDHLYFLQTDWDCMRETIDGFRHTDFARDVGQSFYPVIADEFATRLVRRLEDLSFLVEECEHVKGMYEKHRDSTRIGKPLSKEYGHALGCPRCYFFTFSRKSRPSCIISSRDSRSLSITITCGAKMSRGTADQHSSTKILNI
jgi:hypothetical protein